MMQVTISLGQMRSVTGELAANLDKARKMAEEAAARKSDLLVLPELWECGYDLPNAAKYAAPLGEGVFAEMEALARQHRLHICGSNLLAGSDASVQNAAVMFDPQGSVLGAYSKVHLFRPISDDRYLAPGSSLEMVSLPWGKAGLAICYDLRFPEVMRAYGVGGASMVLLPAAWPYPRLGHWRTLIQARAIENQLFVVACNRVGFLGDTEFFGHSMIVDPGGEIIVEGGEEEYLLTATIDLDRLVEVRSLFNVYDDRRPSASLL